MCGICGFVDGAGDRPAADIAALVAAMAATLARRGPDGEGVWVDAAAGVGLGHRRLAIIDLSPGGRQPRVSADGRLVITYNGEIYNYRELRAELETAGHRFESQSDTEVLVEACAAWGVEHAVERLVGIFAFALWDRASRTLTLARDHLGVKPLYWTWTGGRLLFGSELKALRAHPGWLPELDRDAVAAYLRFNYVPAPRTIHKGVFKLEPGCRLTLRAGAEPVVTRYWDLRTVARAGLADRLEDLSDAEAVDRLETLLRDAVGRQMVADVPLGAFLSGGIDSSVVAALMQTQSPRPVRSFTIGFHDPGYDEARQAKAVAAHLGTDHTELYVEPSHALDVIPRLPEWFDEPFADVSQIPTFLVAEMTRRHVTVALSGDGGDELFAGYNRYLWGDAVWRRLGRLPGGLRAGLAGALTALPPARWDAVFRMVPARLRPRQAGEKLHKLARVLGHDRPDALYRGLVSQWDEPAALVPGAVEPRGILWDAAVAAEVPDFMERMQLFDSLTYLPDDILTKVDRASMANGLEARVPLLDHRLVAFAWRLPRRFKLRDGTGKWLLRQVLYRHVPPALVDRPKMGFAVPLDAWLRGPLRDWAEALLDERRLREEGLLEPGPIRRLWAEHLSGTRNGQYPLWGVLMLQAWRERWT